MFWFKSCPKCQGDLYRDTDQFGVFISCVQCGRSLTQLEETQEYPSRISLSQLQVVPIELEPVTA